MKERAAAAPQVLGDSYLPTMRDLSQGQQSQISEYEMQRRRRAKPIIFTNLDPSKNSTPQRLSLKSVDHHFGLQAEDPEFNKMQE